MLSSALMGGPMPQNDEKQEKHAFAETASTEGSNFPAYS